MVAFLGESGAAVVLLMVRVLPIDQGSSSFLPSTLDIPVDGKVE
ncbi:hypothetical protein [Ilumatobacter sp.]